MFMWNLSMPGDPRHLSNRNDNDDHSVTAFIRSPLARSQVGLQRSGRRDGARPSRTQPEMASTATSSSSLLPTSRSSSQEPVELPAEPSSSRLQFVEDKSRSDTRSEAVVSQDRSVQQSYYTDIFELPTSNPRRTLSADGTRFETPGRHMHPETVSLRNGSDPAPASTTASSIQRHRPAPVWTELGREQQHTVRRATFPISSPESIQRSTTMPVIDENETSHVRDEPLLNIAELSNERIDASAVVLPQASRHEVEIFNVESATEQNPKGDPFRRLVLE